MDDNTVPLSIEPAADAWQGSLDVDLLSEWLLAGDSGEPSASSEQTAASRHSLVDALALSSHRSSARDDRTARRRAKNALLARSIRRRKKSEKLLLCEQADELTAQLAALRETRRVALGPGNATAIWEERAAAQRLARLHATERNLQLKRALAAYRAFLSGMRGVLAGSPAAGEMLDLRALLHSYTHLRADPASRTHDLAASFSDERLDVAVQIVSKETSAVAAVEAPSFLAKASQCPRPSDVGWTLVGVYALDTKDVRRIFGAAHSVLLSSCSAWPSHTLLSAQRNVMDASVRNASYCVSSARYLSDASGEQVAVETRRISRYRVTDTCAVLSWDYPDVDDAYPARTDGAALRRDMAGAAVVRREVCPDGVERTVCRIICTAVTSSCSPADDATRQFVQLLPQAGHAGAVTAYEYIAGHAHGTM